MRASVKSASQDSPDGDQIVVNGKFLSAEVTGVHRVALEILKALDGLLAHSETSNGLRFMIAAPRDSQERLALPHIVTQTVGWLTWKAWENISLPRFAGRRLILNLCNQAPLWRTGVLMMHDAQVYISPQSYSKAFVAFYKVVQPIMARRARHILTVSAYSKAMLVKYGLAPADKITVIHNGVDHILRVEPDVAALAGLALTEGRYVVALANTQAHKNVGVLLAAFADPALADARLVLVGGATAAVFTAAGHNCPHNTVFAGRVSDEALRALLEGAACLAFPSTTEGFGLPPLEAMILGCPAVVAPCGALPEVCGEAAVYADPHDVKAWVRAILPFIGEPKVRAAAGATARQHASAFTWARSATQLLDLLAKLEKHAAIA
jgi:glycosyltransferase involved in cell wall biosynthesis